MNKILVRDGIVQNIDNDDYVIDNNKILFKQSGTYYLEYLNNMTVDLEIEIDGGIDVLLIETSFDNKLVINNKLNDCELLFDEMECLTLINFMVINQLMNK